MRIEGRFFFSQLSALAVIALAFFGWVAIVKSTFGPLRVVTVGGIGVVLFLMGAFVFCAACVFVWRLLLVRLGFLSSEEAQGYPYSRPWTKRL